MSFAKKKTSRWICSCKRINNFDEHACGYCKQSKPEKEEVEKKTGNRFKKTTANDEKLWDIFSIYIRLRDANKNGMITCVTSGRVVHWKDSDAGHFISRRHLSTKFDEQNVHAQSRHDNRFQYGRQFEYAKFIDKKYGIGTADKLLVKSRMICKRGQFEIDTMSDFYKKEVDRIKTEKKLE